MMPWREAYWPVRIEARFGEHSGVGWNAFSNIAPSCARRSMCGVFMYGWPEAPVSSKRRSSIRMTMRLGFLATMVSFLAGTAVGSTAYRIRHLAQGEAQATTRSGDGHREPRLAAIGLVDDQAPGEERRASATA
jgi:hypothetical protein